MALPLSEDKIEILPECVNFNNSIAFLETARAEMGYAWAEGFYKIINILYRFELTLPNLIQPLKSIRRS